MTAIPSQITSASIVCQTVVQAQIKENITAPRHQPFVGDRWIFLPKASETENVSIWLRHHGVQFIRIRNKFFVGL